ncbi:MAG: glycosyltransferase family 39 protein [Candidatus Riflebacteria bacterium]|nr:glycosyltransferase family 39 protein [Candidatus Riflebacteria bacterium]
MSNDATEKIIEKLFQSPLEEATISLGKKIHPQKIQFCLVIFVFSLLFYQLGKISLQETTETKIASTSRLMIETNNFSIPFNNGKMDLSIPPLTYWLSAAGLKLFGNDEFGARVFVPIAGLLTVIGCHKIGLILFGSRTALLSTLVLMTSCFFSFEFKKLSVFPFSVLWQTWMIYSLFKAQRSSKKGFILYFWFFAALAFLTEGPASLIPLAGLIPCSIIFGKGDQIKKVLLDRLGWLIFFFLGLGWFIWMALTTNEAFLFFIKTWFLYPLTNIIQINDRKIPFYFLWATLIGFFPWTFFFLAGINKSFREARNPENENHLLLLSWLIIPTIILSFSKNIELGDVLKLALPISLICGSYLASKLHFAQDETFSFKLESAFTLVTMAFLGLLLVYASWSGAIPDPSLAKVTFFLSMHFLFLVIFGYSSIQMDFTKGMILGLAITVPGIIFFALPGIAGDEQFWAGKFFPGSREILKKVAQLPPTSQVINLCNSLYGIPFYTGKVVNTIENDGKFENSLLFKEKLRSVASEGTFLLISPEDLDFLSQLSGRELKENFSKGKWSLCCFGKELKTTEDESLTSSDTKQLSSSKETASQAKELSKALSSSTFSISSASTEITKKEKQTEKPSDSKSNAIQKKAQDNSQVVKSSDGKNKKTKSKK